MSSTRVETVTCDVCGAERDFSDHRQEWFNISTQDGYRKDGDVCGYDLNLAEPYQAFYLRRVEGQSFSKLNEIIMDLNQKKAEDISKQINARRKLKGENED